MKGLNPGVISYDKQVEYDRPGEPLLDLDSIFDSDLKYLRKICDIKCITGLKLIKNILSFVLTLVPRTLEIAFQGIEISEFYWDARPQTPL